MLKMSFPPVPAKAGIRLEGRLRRESILILILILAISGCAALRPKTDMILNIDSSSVIAIVLGEGLSRSYAHVGVLKALEEEDIPIHMVVGSGMGGFMGALYANKQRANDLEWHAQALKKSDYIDSSSLVVGSRIEKFLQKRLVHTKLEKLPISLIISTVDLKTGKSFLYQKGNIAKAVHAGMAIPSIFKPVRHENMLLVSGEIRRGIPVDVAEDKGADLIIAVDLTQGIDRYRFRRSRDMAIQSYQISSAALSQEQLKKAHVVIRPKVGHIDFLDFGRKREAILAGYQATQEIMPELNKILDRIED